VAARNAAKSIRFVRLRLRSIRGRPTFRACGVAWQPAHTASLAPHGPAASFARLVALFLPKHLGSRQESLALTPVCSSDTVRAAGPTMLRSMQPDHGERSTLRSECLQTSRHAASGLSAAPP